MTFRKLRIAFSATCLIACVLLVALWVRDYRDTGLAAVPYFFPAGILFGFAIAPWATGPARFSLRTLLIDMTLVAVVLGAVVYATRQ